MKSTLQPAASRVKTVEEYIASFPPDIQIILEEMRAIVKQAAPKATELISYGMPAVKMNSVLVYYAAFKNHIGFYPTGSGMAAFAEEVTTYTHSKGAVRFTLDEPLPKALIAR